MMRNTPRTFVGTVVFVFEGPASTGISEAVHARVRALPGIGRCELDTATGTLVVTAESPVDRGDVLEILDAFGCRVLS